MLKERRFHGLSFPFFADWVASQWYLQQLIIWKHNVREEHLIFFSFSVIYCNVTARKRKSRLMWFATVLMTSSMYHRGPQNPIWDLPSRSKHYKEKRAVCSCSGTWSSMKNLDLCFGREAGGRALGNSNSCSSRGECPPHKSIIAGILYHCLSAVVDLNLTVCKLFPWRFLKYNP